MNEEEIINRLKEIRCPYEWDKENIINLNIQEYINIIRNSNSRELHKYVHTVYIDYNKYDCVYILFGEDETLILDVNRNEITNQDLELDGLYKHKIKNIYLEI